ncbi:MAG: hypothetical protein FWG18_03370 [Alphaproteobacteria bacterium]|nr:hypothetical protein [Alphaproteobacteria bacterium]
MLSAQDIKQDTKITVNGAPHSVLAKVLYISVNTGRKYYKVFLSGGFVLGYSLPDDSAPAFFGELIEPLPYVYDELPGELMYNGKLYKQDGEDDYERVLNFEFGDLKDAEGECRFMNYAAKDGDWLSPGLITQNGKRADFYGRDISEYDIKLF